MTDTTALRRWPRAAWIIGNGPHASVAHCDETTVMLFETRAEADLASSFIGKYGCGHACHRDHEVVDING